MINAIRVSNIRGVKRISDINLQKRSLVLWGENGAGKSSIIDAIELALTGTVKHLDSSGQNVSVAKHCHHISATPQDMKIEIIMDDESILTNVGIPKAGSKADKLKSSSLSGLNILRRSQLLEAVFAQPKGRYERLRPFLPLTKLTEYEKALSGAYEHFVTNQDSIEKKLNAVRIKIATSLNIDIQTSITEEKVLKALSDLSAKAGLSNNITMDSLSEFHGEVSSQMRQKGNISYIQRMQLLADKLSALQKIENPKLIIGTFERAKSEHTRITQTETDSFFEDVLRLGSQWIINNKLDHCPLCENVIDRDNVISRINERLSERQDFIKTEKQLTNSRKIVDSQIAIWNEFSGNLQKIYSELADDDLQPSIKAIIDALDHIIQTGKTIIEQPFVVGSENIDRKVYALKQDASILFAQTEQRIPKEFSDEIATLSKLSNSIEIIITNYPVQKKLEKYLSVVKHQIAIIYRFRDQLVIERKKMVQKIYDKIKNDINLFYDQIHPDENIGSIALSVKDTGGGSALLQGNYYSKSNQDPRAYYSESHLDSLGLSIFLALYKRHSQVNPDLKFLVLDDVLTSVDAPHRKRIAQTLLTEFTDHQIIMTTHDIIWFKNLMELQQSLGIKNKFMNVEIYGWDIITGPKMKLPESEAHRIMRYIEQGEDKSIICAATGRFFEMILGQLRYSFRLSIPAVKDDKYTIGDIWPKLVSILKSTKTDYNKFRMIYDASQRHVDDIILFLENRNLLGAHYNSWSDEISRDEAVYLGNAVLGFWKYVWCEACNEFITLNSEKTKCRCKCDKLIYDPS